MRIWQDDQGNLITDEQLLRYVAHHGSLSKALSAGEVRLVANSAAASPAASSQQPKRRRVHAKLSTRL